MIDASVIGSIAFNEPEAERARELIAGSELHAPELLDYELASIARRKIRQFPELREVVMLGLTDALDASVARWPVVQREVVALALEKDLSTYDASYLWLARYLGVPLATFDKRLNAAAADE